MEHLEQNVKIFVHIHNRKLARRKFIPHLESLKFLPKSWTNYVSNFLKEGKKGEYKISPAMPAMPAMQAKLHEHFAPLNDKLQEEYTLDLKSYNYPLT